MGHLGRRLKDFSLSRLTTLTGCWTGWSGWTPLDALLPSERRRANSLRTMTLTSFGSLLLAH